MRVGSRKLEEKLWKECHRRPSRDYVVKNREMGRQLENKVNCFVVLLLLFKMEEIMSYL